MPRKRDIYCLIRLAKGDSWYWHLEKFDEAYRPHAAFTGTYEQCIAHEKANPSPIKG